MNVTQKIKMDMLTESNTKHIDVVQGDAYTRYIEFSLYSNGQKWNIPDGVSASIGYSGVAGRGLYDTLPDGSRAYTVSENVITVTLIPQISAMHGITKVAVVFTDDDGKQIATFGVNVRVSKNPAMAEGNPAEYYNLREWASTPLSVFVEKNDDSFTVDEEYKTILADFMAGRQVMVFFVDNENRETVYLSSASAFDDYIEFSGFFGDDVLTATIGNDGKNDYVKVARKPYANAPLYVTMSGTADSGYSTDYSYEQIKKAYDDGRSVFCVYSTTVMSLCGISASLAMFQATLNSTYRRAFVYADTSKQPKTETVKFALEDDLPAPTDEIYFDITEDGVISLKPEYRGAVTGTNTAMYSDNGKGRSGTQNRELPEEIIIPNAVNGISVTALASGMFRGNEMVKHIVLPDSVTIIPPVFCDKAYNLEGVSNTKNIVELGQQSFAKSGIKKAYFPNLETAGTTVFQKCANLAVVDLGDYFSGENKEVPAYFFNSCEKLACLRNAEGITRIGGYGMYGTKRITGLPVENISNIGAYGLTFSREDYSGWSENSFGTMSNSTWINNTEYTKYSGNGYATPLKSTFNQGDPRWTDKNIGNTNEPYSSGCMTLCAAMAYSAIMDVAMESPEDFVEIVGNVDESLLDIVIDQPSDPSEGFAELETWLNAVGLSTEVHYSNSNVDVQAMYNALESGKMVIARTYGGYDGTNQVHLNHIVLIRGINKSGELLVVDPTSASSEIGIYDVATFPMPIQNIMRDATGAENTGETIEDGFVIVEKE
jgi:hypothetical protein